MWDSITLSNFTASACPECQKLFVNSTLADVCWVIACFVLFLGVYSVVPLPTIALLVLTPLVALLARVFFVRPIPYAKFKAYGVRPWWKNAVIFGLIPLAIVAVLVLLLMFFRVGQ